MDPFTTAGLGLGITSLTLQLLGGCIKGYEMFLRMSEMPSQYEHLRVRMSLEQSRLLNWGEKVGLLEETLEQPSLTLQLHRNVIVDVLSEIQRLFKDCLKIQSQIERVAEDRNAGLVKHAKQLTTQRSEKDSLLAEAIRAWDKTTEFPTRLQWALVKQEKFERLVEKLINYNDAIVSLLDRTTIQQLHDMQVQSQLTMLQLTSQVDDLHKLALAIQVQTSDRINAPPTNQVQRAPGVSARNPYGGSSFARLATFKAQQLALETDSETQGAGLIDRALLLLKGTYAARSLAVYRQDNVWVEWKDYDPDNQLLSQQGMIEQRVQKLATLLSIEDTPQEFRAPHCVGYIHDKDEDTARYGLVYSLPHSIPGSVPSTLLDAIQHGAKPSLTQRIRLAHIITSSLMYLHSVNWLHKGIRSGNIVFFVPPGQKPDYDAPIISGLEYARPDLPEELTEKPSENFEYDLYRHPDALGRSDVRSKKSWDIYSLGVVLIELAFWKSIGDILDLHVGQRRAWSRLRKVREMLLSDEFLNRVGVEAGEIYQDVVRRCIAGGMLLGIPEGVDEGEPDVGAEMQRVLSELVVGKLSSMKL
ncbi:hypothetical protein LTR70_000666 [Exophiala xenobiotica]|uniref:Protein kinase domain-containing protein n=1 Tax=Lithohypha guttulata TaxID=1690604 RepID=A0ABR0KIH6_9EURO|nr:hypothetical protein LTR24_002087 [Lithohypha guttulata]KAK5329517.1 hypothetical protein LTR70_000666 [Exophiala xenobiotica]